MRVVDRHTTTNHNSSEYKNHHQPCHCTHSHLSHTSSQSDTFIEHFCLYLFHNPRPTSYTYYPQLHYQPWSTHGSYPHSLLHCLAQHWSSLGSDPRTYIYIKMVNWDFWRGTVPFRDLWNFRWLCFSCQVLPPASVCSSYFHIHACLKFLLHFLFF